MVASLNIMAKTFVKIVKTFVGLSTTIVAIRIRHVLIFHLEAKYAKMNCKNGIYVKTRFQALELQKGQRSKSKSTVNDLVNEVNYDDVSKMT